MNSKKLIAFIIFVLLILGVYFVVQNKPISGKTDKQEVRSNQPSQIVSTGTQVGDIAPAYFYTTIEGKKVESSQFNQKIAVITSSSAWCQTCILEAQQFAPVYEKYKNKEVRFISVDIDPRNTKDAITQLKENTNTPWDYADANGGREIIQKYELNRFEITYIIDANGVIRFKDRVITSTEKLEQEIEKLLL